MTRITAFKFNALKGENRLLNSMVAIYQTRVIGLGSFVLDFNA